MSDKPRPAYLRFGERQLRPLVRRVLSDQRRVAEVAERLMDERMDGAMLVALQDALEKQRVRTDILSELVAQLIEAEWLHWVETPRRERLEREERDSA